ncbi:MAG TPA: NAD(P)H-dependent glycerol-3-phosphate dehydrogenase [Bacteroidia bacterium]|nr:NAD(P)H-dependent glycerol-3-phosphate dehydrogenase [Bacteroidia bacterium]HNU33386.1 NAD(P)H-dependent glycerol-3-phosphate dehydrogenase [Bacteroidia bacterium]
MKKPNNVSVIGGGSWATALVKILSNNCRVNWWLRNKSNVDFILKNKHNPSYLTDVTINIDKVNVTDNLIEALKKSEIIILAVPSAFLKDSLKEISKEKLAGKKIFSAIKGIVPDDLLIVGEYLQHAFNVPVNNIGVVTGPCHAEEVAMERLSYLTVACNNVENAKMLAQLLECRFIKTTVSDDIYGTEYSAVLKNVIAIASGICHSLGYGDNFHAVLISNAIREIKRFVDEAHPINRDINDSAYLGDLLVTAYSQFSRNRLFGSMIGKGYSVKAAQMEMNMIAEGYYAVKCIQEINKKFEVDMPICNAVYNILYLNKNARVEIAALTELLN